MTFKNSKILMLAALAVMSLVLFSGCSLLSLFSVTGTVTGYVIDSTSGDGVEGVTVFYSDNPFFTTESLYDGSFSLDVPVGIGVISFEKDGYTFQDLTVTVEMDYTTNLNSSDIIANPNLSTGQLRFVLTWGDTPRDLDSHLLLPNNEHIYYSNKTGTGVNLDVDDTSSYGPETTTITSQLSGEYNYYVYNFSGSPDIAGCGAIVRIFDSNGLLSTVYIPSSGTGRYWNVATIDGSYVTINNTIQTTAP